MIAFEATLLNKPPPLAGVSDKKTRNALERAIKAVPSGSALFDQNINQIIFGNKVAFMDYNSETALVIENRAIADFQREVF